MFKTWETNLYGSWKITSRDGDHLNRIITGFHDDEWLGPEIKSRAESVSYHKLYDILKQHQNEVNEIRMKGLARTANPLPLLLNNNQFTILLKTLNIPPPDRNSLPETEEKQLLHLLLLLTIQNLLRLLKIDENVKGKEMTNFIGFISSRSRKFYKPDNNNLRTSSKTPVELIRKFIQELTVKTGYDNQGQLMLLGARGKCRYSVSKSLGFRVTYCKEFTGHVSWNVETKRVKDARTLRVQLNAETDDWKDDTDDESEEQGKNGRTLYVHGTTSRGTKNIMTTINGVCLENEHPVQPESSNEIYLTEQGDSNIPIDSLDICYDRAQDDQDELLLLIQT
ncbi:hypothetical protein Tco_0661514 [Tanacetum coccineum]